MPLVFISYCRENQHRAESLAEDLKLLGHEVWLDQHLHGGQDWWGRILEEIRRCDVFVYAIDAASLGSEACQLEFQYAYDLKKRILPVLVSEDVSPDDLASKLVEIQYVDDRQNSREGYQAFIRALNSLPPPEPLPDPLPPPPEAPLSYKVRWKTRVEAPRLSLEEQSALVVELAYGLEDLEKAETALAMLRQFRRRADLFPAVIKVTELVLNHSGPPPLPWWRKIFLSVVEDISVKQVWISLVGGVLISEVLWQVRRLDNPTDLQSWLIQLRRGLLWSQPATLLLCISVLWKKLENRPVYAKVALIVVPSILGYIITTVNIFGERKLSNWEFGLSGAATALIIVIIVFWKETPKTALPLKSACMSLAGGIGVLIVLCLPLGAASQGAVFILELTLATLFAIYALFKLSSMLVAFIRSKSPAR